MLRVTDKIVDKVWRRLMQMYRGDVLQIEKAIDEVINGDRSWGSSRYKILETLIKEIDRRYDSRTQSLAIQACKQIKEWLATETVFPPWENLWEETTEKRYNQLTLDFSATVEKPASEQPREEAVAPSPVSPEWEEEEQLVYMKFNQKWQKKGWLTPQYKYFDEDGRSHTTSNPRNVRATKIYGPYWTYRWSKPGKKDEGILYLGAKRGKKFQHFSTVWDDNSDAKGILTDLHFSTVFSTVKRGKNPVENTVENIATRVKTDYGWFEFSNFFGFWLPAWDSPKIVYSLGIQVLIVDEVNNLGITMGYVPLNKDGSRPIQGTDDRGFPITKRPWKIET